MGGVTEEVAQNWGWVKIILLFTPVICFGVGVVNKDSQRELNSEFRN